MTGAVVRDLALNPGCGAIAGLFAGVLVTGGLRVASTLFFLPKGREREFVQLYDAIPFAVALVVALAVLGLDIRRPHAALGWFLGMCFPPFFAVGTLAAMGFSLYAGPPDPRLTLGAALAPISSKGPPGDLSGWTVERLNRTRSQLAGITYLETTESSTGPLVVSVNFIDERTVGLAAWSWRGVCLLMVAGVGEAGHLTHWWFGEVESGPCVGAAATRATVTSEDMGVWYR